MKQAAEAGVSEFPNYMYFRGYNSTNGFGDEPITQYLTLANQDVICYQLFDDVSLPLIEGHMPTHLNEIAINHDLAKDLMRYFQLENITDLIGKEVILNYVSFINNPSSSYKEYPVIISGISHMECELETQVYFKDGGFDKIFVDEFGCDPSIATYQYMRLLIDPSLNVEKVSDQTNTLLQSKNSHFMSLGTMQFSKENFQDMKILMIFFLFASFVVMTMYLLMHLLLNKRMTKEQHILTSYNYHPYPMTVCMLMVLCLIVAGLQSIFLESVCVILNLWLNQLGFQSIFSYRFDYALLSLALTFVFFAILEVILYVFRTKQH